MTLSELIRKQTPVAVATATPATERAGCRPCVATVANVAGVPPYREQGESLSSGNGQEGAQGWRAAWHELADLTSGVTADDPRFAGVMAALDQCDVAYHDGNREAFHQATAQVRKSLAEGDTHERP